MIYANTPSEIRNLLPELRDKVVAEAFYSDEEEMLQLVFLDGTRLSVTCEPIVSEVILEKTNGKGGWI